MLTPAMKQGHRHQVGGCALGRQIIRSGPTLGGASELLHGLRHPGMGQGHGLRFAGRPAREQDGGVGVAEIRRDDPRGAALGVGPEIVLTARAEQIGGKAGFRGADHRQKSRVRHQPVDRRFRHGVAQFIGVVETAQHHRDKARFPGGEQADDQLWAIDEEQGDALSRLQTGLRQMQGEAPRQAVETPKGPRPTILVPQGDPVRRLDSAALEITGQVHLFSSPAAPCKLIPVGRNAIWALTQGPVKGSLSGR